ncbi:MAG: PAS domain-containing protein [Myxococcales bacterium]|nr:PAS domain-containing protein [Myxococcales bacterium]
MRETPDYRQLVASMDAVPWELDVATWRFTFVGEQAEALLGYACTRWYEEDFWYGHVHPEDRDAALAFCQAAVERREDHSFEYRMMAADGREVWVRDDVTLVVESDGYLRMSGFLFDVTERVAREQTVREQKQQLEAAQRLARLGSWSLWVGTARVALSAEASRLYRLERQTTVEGLIEAVAPADRSRFASALSEATKLGRPLSLEHGVMAPDGTARTLLSQASLTGDPDDGGHWSGTVQDITERRQVEDVMATLAHVGRAQDIDGFLRECVRNLARHYATRFAFIGLLQPDRRHVRTLVVWAGDDFAENFDYALEGTPCEDVLDLKKELTPRNAALLYPQDTMLVDMGIESYFGAPMIGSDGVTLGIIAVMDTEPLELQLWTAPVLGLYAGRIAVELQRKFESEHAAAQEDALRQELLQARKLESIGRLAGGIAHDFNNLLMVIAGSAELLRESLPNSSELEGILEASERARSLTAQMLAFGRKQRLEPRPVDLNEVVVGASRMIERLIAGQVELATALEAERAVVVADRTQLEQVLINLVVNARDAMPLGGKVTVATRNVDDPWTGMSGPFVELSVADQGEGMDEATQGRIFEPFFTTKPHHKGTGLGLATTYGIVRQSGGDIRVHSRPSEGATFTIVLPRSKEPAERPPREVSVPSAVEAGSGHVLIIEDEPAVVQVARSMLEREGYSVLVAADGEEAERVLTAHSQPVVLALVDCVLGGSSSGVEIATLLRNVQPRLPILFVSGFTEQKLPSDDRIGFLSKPFTAAQLASHIRVLAQEGAARPHGS